MSSAFDVIMFYIKFYSQNIGNNSINGYRAVVVNSLNRKIKQYFHGDKTPSSRIPKPPPYFLNKISYMI